MTTTLTPQPCPFCGSDAILYETDHSAHVECCLCEARAGEWATIDRAVESWNAVHHENDGPITNDLTQNRELWRDLAIEALRHNKVLANALMTVAGRGK